jgi:hypothetical protein
VDDFLPIYSQSLLSGDIFSPDRSVTERGRALEAFLVDPADACVMYAALKWDLITFFAQSTNPHIDDCGKPQAIYAERCEQWESAHVWAVERLERPEAKSTI